MKKTDEELLNECMEILSPFQNKFHYYFYAPESELIPNEFYDKVEYVETGSKYSGRWTETVWDIFSVNGTEPVRYIAIENERPLTEMQEGGETMFKAFEVRASKIETIVFNKI